MSCHSAAALLRSPSLRRTLTTVVIALGSSIVMALGG